MILINQKALIILKNSFKSLYQALLIQSENSVFLVAQVNFRSILSRYLNQIVKLYLILWYRNQEQIDII